jgi:ribosome-binding factor A
MRELTQLLRRAKDPRLGGITVQEVRVSRDLAHAKVYFTCFGADEEAVEQQRLLNTSLAGFLRHELARTARLRTVPALHFVYDESIGRGERLAALIDKAVGNDQARASTTHLGAPNENGDQSLAASAVSSDER